MIYLDHSSTSFPKAPGVGDAIKTTLDEHGVNIGRGNYEEAFAVEAEIAETRQLLATFFGYDDPRQVVFTPSVTYSINMFLYGFLRSGDHIVVSGMEHNAVMRPVTQLSRLRDIRFSIVPANTRGEVSPDDVKKAILPETRAVVMLHASNVTGTLLPAAEIGQLCHDRGICYALDTAQSAGSVPIDMTAMHIDFLAFTGHKGLLGPQGVGGFIATRALSSEMEPLILGGTGSQSNQYEQPEFMPDKFESGTPNIPGIIGLRAALLYLKKTGIEDLHRREMALTSLFLDGLKEISGVVPVGLTGIEGRTAVVSVNIPEKDNSLIAYELERQGAIKTRVGLHCAPLAHKSLGTFPEGTIRFSFGATNTEEEIRTALETLSKIMSE
ncbi:MAG: aminotransferase class V-fold PLP-dependent enzyme [Clostridiaceae bacterium]|jgi:cysteine desulfurase family protein|nr:aminotransferase class V-fold PLP-dependent enzyme [Clostridiaceae bacterium]